MDRLLRAEMDRMRREEDGEEARPEVVA
jgi:hypothetical protein